MFSKKIVCESCGTIGYPKTQVKGSLLVEIFLWIIFLIPGIIYSIWRRASPKQVCRACGSTSIIPVDSPRGKTLVK